MKLDMDKEYKKVSKEVVDEENLAGDLIARKCHFLYLVKKEIEYSKLSQSKENYYLNIPRLCAGIDKVNKKYLEELYLKRSITREKASMEQILRKDYSKYDERIIKSLNSYIKKIVNQHNNPFKDAGDIESYIETFLGLCGVKSNDKDIKGYRIADYIDAEAKMVEFFLEPITDILRKGATDQELKVFAVKCAEDLLAAQDILNEKIKEHNGKINIADFDAKSLKDVNKR